MAPQILENFFTKKGFDYDCPNLDLFKFHPQLRIFLVFNGIFFNNPDSYLRFVWPILCAIIALVASSFELLFIYHGVTVQVQSSFATDFFCYVFIIVTMSLIIHMLIFVWPILCAITALVASSFELLFIYHGVAVQDYSFATECFCYFIIVTTSPIIYMSVLLNRNKLVGLLDSMDRDFQYICTLGSPYRSTFLKGQLRIWQLCIIWFTFIFCIAIMYLVTTFGALTYQSLFATQTVDMVRPLMFPLWLPADDPYRTPNYEIFLILEIGILVIIIQTFCVYVYVFFHVLLHHYYLMSMIHFDCDVLFVGLDESVVKLSRYDPRRKEVQEILNSRMRRIVKWHNLVFQSIDSVSYIYGPPLVYQVMFSSLPICLMAYQVADSLDHGKFNVIFATLGFATCVQLWIPCYLGTLIRNKAFSVGEAIWCSGWHETPLGRLLRADITMVIMRSQRPVSIKFPGLPNLELETFSSIMSTAYTYFTLLRQYTSKDK